MLRISGPFVEKIRDTYCGLYRDAVCAAPMLDFVHYACLCRPHQSNLSHHIFINQQTARVASKEDPVNQPNYESLERSDRPLDTVTELGRAVLQYVARIFGVTVFLGVCAAPFLMIEDKTKVTFWYCVGAYGVYLLGASHMLNRRF